jgi:hypothetical protein
VKQGDNLVLFSSIRHPSRVESMNNELALDEPDLTATPRIL